jgi:hypothetical protein
MQRGVKLQSRITPRSWSKRRKDLGCESGAQVGTSDGKNRRSKIWRHSPFNERIILLKTPTFHDLFLWSIFKMPTKNEPAHKTIHQRGEISCLGKMSHSESPSFSQDSPCNSSRHSVIPIMLSSWIFCAKPVVLPWLESLTGAQFSLWQGLATLLVQTTQLLWIQYNCCGGGGGGVVVQGLPIWDDPGPWRVSSCLETLVPLHGAYTWAVQRLFYWSPILE